MENNKYFYVSYEKENVDSVNLIKQIAGSGYVDKNTTIVNCDPLYSSRLTQLVCHKLSYLNNHQLFEVVDLPMPYPIMNQVWDTLDQQYYKFDKYLSEWARRYIITGSNYLFIATSTLRGKNFSYIKREITRRLQPEYYRFASLYLQSDSIFTPDHYVEEFDKDEQGGLLFEWENVDNPNWDY